MNAPDLNAIKDDFDRDGFTVARALFSKDEVDHMIREIYDHIDELPEKNVYYEDKSQPDTLFRIDSLNDVDFFADLSNDPRLQDIARTVLNDEPDFQNVMLFAKAPRIGNATPAHQDGRYWMIEPMNGVTFWLALDTVDEENGCLRFIKGTHLEGEVSHDIGETFGFSLGLSDASDVDTSREAMVTLESGDMSLHHGHTVHMADPNTSDRLRRGVGITFFGKNVTKNQERRLAHAAAVKEKWTEKGLL